MKPTPLEVLQSMEEVVYSNEDGDTYSIRLLPGMSPEEIAKVAARMPGGHLPVDIVELLSYARGLKNMGMDEILFTDHFRGWHDQFFSHPITLSGDGRGNSWLVDIDSKGNWGPVYFMDHDPSVLIKYANDLAEFLSLLDEDGENPGNSFFQRLYSPISIDIYRRGEHPLATPDHNYDLSCIPDLPVNYRIESLEGQPPGAGFMWAPNNHWDFVHRLGDLPVWVIEVRERRSLLERIFSLFR